MPDATSMIRRAYEGRRDVRDQRRTQSPNVPSDEECGSFPVEEGVIGADRVGGAPAGSDLLRPRDEACSAAVARHSRVAPLPHAVLATVPTDLNLVQAGRDGSCLSATGPAAAPWLSQHSSAPFQRSALVSRRSRVHASSEFSDRQKTFGLPLTMEPVFAGPHAINCAGPEPMEYRLIPSALQIGSSRRNAEKT